MSFKSVSSQDLQNFLASEDIDLIVQKNQNYYKSKWNDWVSISDVIVPQKTLSWNWPAFFLQEFWLLYRKLYGFFAIVFTIRLTTFISIIVFPWAEFFFSPITLAMSVVIPLLANGLCLRRYMNVYEHAQNQYGKNEEEKKQYYDLYSATSYVVPIAFFLLMSFSMFYVISYVVKLVYEQSLL